MIAIFDTIQDYLNKLREVNTHLGYPDGRGTERYATETPQPTKQGKYAMPISERIAHLFADCEIVDGVEYPDEMPEL